ncbi:MAG: histidine kinase [Chitinophagaceae bacterium]
MNDNLYMLILLAMLGTALLVVSFIVLQIRSQNKVLLQKRRMQEAELFHQKALLEAMITSQEAERKRIGMDLHDEVGVVLAALRMNMEKLAAGGNASAASLIPFKSGIDRVMENVRHIAHSLSPRISGSFGFYDALHELTDEINRSGKITVAVHFPEQHQPVFADGQHAMALYRVLAELISNTVKHALATGIKIGVMLVNGRMEIEYEDNGKGMPAGDRPAKGMGLHNIESRLTMIGASWQVHTESGKGYRIFISTPLK